MPTHKFLGVSVIILSKIDDIELDVVDEVTVTHDALITKNPRESGLNVSDNIVHLPTVINLSGRFVDSPFSTFPNPLEAVASLVSAFSGGDKARSIEKWNELEILRERKTVFDVEIQQDIYKNMAVKRLVGPRSKGDGTSQRFQIELHELLTVESAQFVRAAVDASVLNSAPGIDALGIQGGIGFSL